MMMPVLCFCNLKAEDQCDCVECPKSSEIKSAAGSINQQISTFSVKFPSGLKLSIVQLAVFATIYIGNIVLSW